MSDAPERPQRDLAKQHADDVAAIDRMEADFVEKGERLRRIRDTRSYKEVAGYSSFEAFCRERWGFSKERATQLIGAAELVTVVTTEGLPAPANERVARELAPLRHDPEQVREAWQSVVEQHGSVPRWAEAHEHVARLLGLSEGSGGSTPGPDDAVVASRIADFSNRLVDLRREGGALAFDPQGRTPTPEPNASGDAVHLNQLWFPFRDEPVTEQQVLDWLSDYRARQGEIRRLRERQLEAARARGDRRRGEAEIRRGHSSGAFPCQTCGRFKPRPSAVCSFCGSDPVRYDGLRREFDRAHGYPGLP